MTVARGRYASSARYRGGKSAATSNTETTNSSGVTGFTGTAFGALLSCGACQALTSRARLAERHLGRKSEFTVVAVVVLVLLLGIAFAAGYFTRDYVSRKQRAGLAQCQRTGQHQRDRHRRQGCAGRHRRARSDAEPLGEQGSRSPHGVARRSRRMADRSAPLVRRDSERRGVSAHPCPPP